MDQALLSPSQLRYLREVLGVEQILWRKPSASAATVTPPRVAVFVDKMNTLDRELLTKMLNAMKLATQDYAVYEEPKHEEYSKILSQAPILSLIFGHSLAHRLGLQYTPGKFVSQEGVATIVTYGPADLSRNPDLKSDAWKDMKLAMTRLNPA